MPRKKENYTIGIYCITNTINNKKYIGLSTELERRRWVHFWLLRNNRHFNDHLQNAYLKYGEESFEFSILEMCPVEHLSEQEKYWIEKLDTLSNGYNLRTGGHDNLIFSDETKRKISESQKGKVISDDMREHLRRINTGKKLSPEQVKQLSMRWSGSNNPNYGGNFSKEHVHKLSVAKKGKKQTEEHIKNMMEARFGKYFRLQEKIEMYRLNKQDKLTNIQIAEIYNINRRTVGKYINEAEEHLVNKWFSKEDN